MRCRSFAFLVLLHCIVLLPRLSAQITVALTINDGDAATTCTDLFNLPGNAHWGVNVNGQGWTIFPEIFTCPEFESPPYLQYTETFVCPPDVADSIEVCFRAFDKDGLFCFLSPDCEEVVCQTFPLPEPFSPADYTMSLPASGASSGFVNFTIATVGGVATNDLPCDAIDLGVLTPGATLGDNSLSLHTNRCATNANEPNPFFDSGGFFNSQGVWFTFTVGPGVGDLLIVDAASDPSGLGDPIDLELAIYRTSDGTCSGQLGEYRLGLKQGGFDERLLAECLQEGERLYVLVDGSNADQEGYFGLAVTDPQVVAAPEAICDADPLGSVPAGDSLVLTSQTNVCADNLGDPPVPLFGVESSVWYMFSPPPTGNVIIEVVNDPFGIEPLNAQIAVFSSLSGSCTGPFSLEGASYEQTGYGESLEFPCLDPSQTYWLLVDGEGADQDGVFDLILADGGVPPPSVTIDTALCFGESLSIGSASYTSTGTYTELIPLPNGCDSTVTVNLTVWDELIANPQQLAPVTSALVDNGIVGAVPQGGVPPYSYLWNTGDTLTVVGGLAAGVYCLTVSDVVGCTGTACVEVIEDIPEVVATASVTDVSCAGGANGTVTVIVTGADPPYTLSWSGPSITIPADGDSALISGLSAGSYTFLATNAAGWTDSVSVTVSQPPPLEILLVSQEDPLCFGFCDGSLATDASGGVPPYAFFWSGGATGPTRENLCSGTYTLTISDANNCQFSESFTLEDPPQLFAQTSLLSGVTCFGDTDGKASVQINGNAVSWLWDNGEQTPEALMLSAGFHQVTVTDAIGCTAIGSVTIPGPAQPFSIQISLASPITCFGDADGSLLAIPSGGYAGTLTVEWNTGSGNLLIEQLPPGIYSLQATDPGGCSDVDTFTLISPEEIVPVLITTDASCTGQLLDGSVEVVSVSGGQPPFQYGLDNSALISSPLFQNLPPDDYQVILQDANGCQKVFPATVFPPPPVGLQTDPEVTLRLGESIQLDILVAVPDIVISWLPPDGLSCTDCPDPVASPVRDVTYTVTATDPNTGCSEEETVFVRIDPDREVYLPNIFTPNDDGVNDRFTVFSDLNVSIPYLRIYDRWGNQIFERRNVQPNVLEDGWDGTLTSGKPAPSGVYVYLVEVLYADGVQRPVSGSVTLVR